SRARSARRCSRRGPDGRPGPTPRRTGFEQSREGPLQVCSSSSSGPTPHDPRAEVRAGEAGPRGDYEPQPSQRDLTGPSSANRSPEARLRRRARELAVIADGFHRALLLGLEAELDLLVGLGLVVHEVVVAVRGLLEVGRRDVGAEVAEDALLVDVEGAGDV